MRGPDIWQAGDGGDSPVRHACRCAVTLLVTALRGRCISSGCPDICPHGTSHPRTAPPPENYQRGHLDTHCGCSHHAELANSMTWSTVQLRASVYGRFMSTASTPLTTWRPHMLVPSRRSDKIARQTTTIRSTGQWACDRCDRVRGSRIGLHVYIK